MDTQQLLNKYLYPKIGQNVNRHQYPIYSTQTMLTATRDYFFFNNPVAPFVTNKQLPITGSEIFFITGISALPILNHVTTAQVDALNELLQQSFLEIMINNRLAMKIPGLDFINYQFADAMSDQVVVTALKTKIGGNKNTDGFLGRKITNMPLVMNSNSNFQFRLNTPGNAVYNNVVFKLVLHGLQLDKLTSFDWNEIGNVQNQLQQIPYTMWQTIPIVNGNQTQFPILQNRATAQNLFSGDTFPLSDIVTFSAQNFEVFFNQPDVPIDPATIWNSRIQNELYIQIDDRVVYNGDLQNSLSLLAGFGQSLTTTPNLDVVNIFEKRQSRILDVPIDFPANGKVLIQLTQPGGSLGITGEFTFAMRGLLTRRVA